MSLSFLEFSSYSLNQHNFFKRIQKGREGPFPRPPLVSFSPRPNPHLLILTTAPDLGTIGAPIDGKDFVLMARQVLLEETGATIPDFQRGVLARAHEQAAVGAEAGHVDGRDVAAQREQKRARQPVPHLDVVVEPAAGQQQAVGREGHVVDLFLVAQEPRDRLRAVRRLP